MHISLRSPCILKGKMTADWWLWLGERFLIFIKALLNGKAAGEYKYEALCLMLSMAGQPLNVTQSPSLACIKEAPGKP